MTYANYKQRILEWEIKNLTFGKGYYDKYKGEHKNLRESMETRGYDAYRVSPRPSLINGYKYYKVQGATIYPDDRGTMVGKKYAPKVTWYSQGYIKAKKTTRRGTHLIKSKRDLTRDYATTYLWSNLGMRSR